MQHKKRKVSQISILVRLIDIFEIQIFWKTGGVICTVAVVFRIMIPYMLLSIYMVFQIHLIILLKLKWQVLHRKFEINKLILTGRSIWPSLALKRLAGNCYFNHKQNTEVYCQL